MVVYNWHVESAQSLDRCNIQDIVVDHTKYQPETGFAMKSLSGLDEALVDVQIPGFPDIVPSAAHMTAVEKFFDIKSNATPPFGEVLRHPASLAKNCQNSHKWIDGRNRPLVWSGRTVAALMAPFG